AAIPRYWKVPASMVATLAGETLRAGLVIDVGWLATFLVFAALLATVLIVSRKPKIRHWCYALVALSVPLWFVLSAYWRMTAYLSVPIIFLAIYGVARAWQMRNRRTA